MEERPSAEPNTNPEPRQALPAITLRMVDNGDGSVRVVAEIGEVDPWTALTMTARAGLCLMIKIEELEAAKKDEAERQARPRLIVPGRPSLQVNGVN